MRWSRVFLDGEVMVRTDFERHIGEGDRGDEGG